MRKTTFPQSCEKSKLTFTACLGIKRLSSSQVIPIKCTKSFFSKCEHLWKSPSSSSLLVWRIQICVNAMPQSSSYGSKFNSRSDCAMLKSYVSDSKLKDWFGMVTMKMSLFSLKRTWYLQFDLTIMEMFGENTAYQCKYLVQTVKYGGQGVMIWASLALPWSATRKQDFVRSC